ncbi:hypothetical protein [Candidatus Endolissoclinum faulkneri]|nr:hypothetical protein [Candidatus Endolissoclinum faulkneri]
MINSSAFGSASSKASASINRTCKLMLLYAAALDASLLFLSLHS